MEIFQATSAYDEVKFTPSGLNGAESSFAATQLSSWAKPSDWEQHRNTIKRLYLDEDMPLPQVMQVMEQNYGLRAT